MPAVAARFERSLTIQSVHKPVGPKGSSSITGPGRSTVDRRYALAARASGTPLVLTFASD
jgi:hypothetical protein